MDTTGSQKKSKIVYSAYDILILSAWAYVGILYFGVVVLDLLTKKESISFGIYFAFFTILCVLSFKSIISSIKKIDYFVLLFTFVLVYFSINYIYPEGKRTVVNRLPYLFFQVLPFYYIGLFFRFDEDFAYKMYLVSIVGVFLNVVYIFVYLASGRIMVEDNMTMGYQILPYVLYVEWYYLWKRTYFSFFTAAIGVIFVLSMGTRGPALSLLLLPALYFLLEPTISKKKRMITLVSVITVYILSNFLSNKRAFLISLNNSLKSFGLSGRIIDSIFTDIAESSTNVRLRIYDEIWYYITQKPSSGYGLFGDEDLLEYQTHNLFLGVLFHFGLFLGSFFILVFLYLFVKSFIRSRSSIMFGIYLVIFSCAIVRVFVSGTYLCEPFFLLLGVSVNICRKKLEASSPPIISETSSLTTKTA